MAYLYIINSSTSFDAFSKWLQDTVEQQPLAQTATQLNFCQSLSVLKIAKDNFTQLRVKLDDKQLDYIYSPQPLSIPKLAVFDMDSTLIPIEVIDELAGYANKKAEVSQVTELAMQGMLDFDQSLRQRVSHLTDLGESVINDLAGRLQFNSGVKEFCQFLQKNECKLAIASGGFIPFAKALQQKVPFDFIRANRLQIIEQKLTGKVLGTIINAQEKAKAIEEWSQLLDIELAQTIAVGDGANDLLMLDKAGVGLAYKAKPKVNQSANSVLKYSSMAALIDLFEFAKRAHN